MKKRILSILLICCMVFSLFPVSALAANGDMPFTDVKTTDWFYDEVCYVYDEGLMQGTSATTFDPDGTTSRGMIVTILYRLEGEPSLMNANIFTDVEPGSWYEKAVVWANGKSIVEGYGNGKFGPDDPITREQLATIMYRYANYKGYDTAAKADLSDFVDSGKISSYALDAMKWANAAGLINGIGASKLDSQGDATRAQVAAIFYRFCDAFVTEDTYTVTFDLNYGSAGTYTTQNVKSGEKASQPTAPTRSGYTFAGWYKDAVGGSKFDFGTAITADLTLYAHWTKNGGHTPYIPPTPTYTVTFDMQGHGEQIAALTGLPYGSKVTAPTAPTEAGYTFGGWYKEAACETSWNFTYNTVTANITLYAKWSAKASAIEEAVAEGTEIKADGKEITVTSGDNKETASLNEAQATELAGKINDLLENSAVAGSYDNKLETSTNIETTGLDAIIAALKDEAPDAAAEGNLEEKTSEDVDLQIKVVLSSVNVKASDDLTVTSMVFDVTPIATTTVKDENGKTVSVTADISDCLTTAVTFRLPIDSSLNVTDNTIAVYHEGEFLGNYEIKGTAPNTYIEISSKDFSKYGYQVLNENNAGAKIGTTLYFKFADAVAKVETGETITLLKPATGSVTIGREVTFTVDKSGNEFNATVSAATNFVLYKTDETQSTITYKCFPVNTQFTITYKDAGDTNFTGTHGANAPTTHTYGTETTLVAPTKDGYTFGGWFTTSVCTTGTEVTTLGATDYTANITLYAKWVETKTITQLLGMLDTSFPTTENIQNIPSNAWQTADGKQCVICGGDLVFKADYTTVSANMSSSAEASGDDFVYSCSNYTITFHVTDNKIVSIEFKAINQYSNDPSGTYAPAPTFKAVYNTTDDANTLTFYYDAVDHSGDNITVYEDGTENCLFNGSIRQKSQRWGYHGVGENIKNVVIDESVKNYTGLTTTAYMFGNMWNAENITGAEYLNISSVTDMSDMFYLYGYESTNLTAVPNVSNWDTENVTDVSWMFYGYGRSSSALNFTMDFSGWSVANVTTFGDMFTNAGGTGTWSVTIPAKTGEQANDATHWYVGNGTDTGKYIAPASDKTFTLPKTVADILATVDNFPTGYETGWQKSGAPSVVLFNFNSKLYAYNRSSYDYLNIAIETKLTPENDNYSYTHNGIKWIFNMNDGVLESVTISGATGNNESLNGTYAPAAPAPETKTIAEILATVEGGFPNFPDTWESDNGNTCYGDTSYGHLYFFDGDSAVWMDTSDSATKKDNTYVYTDDTSTITFNMDDGKLISITFSDDTYSQYNGTYAPATKTIANILPDGFPTSYETGWKHSENPLYGSLFAYEDGLAVQDYNGDYIIISTTTELTPEDDNYVCTDESSTKWTFNMQEGVLKSVTLSGEMNGTYAPATPAPTTYIVTFNIDGPGVVWDDDMITPVTNITVPSGTTFTTNGNKIRIGETTYVADVTEGGYKFDSFSPSSGTITGATTITVNFSQDQAPE